MLLAKVFDDAPPNLVPHLLFLLLPSNNQIDEALCSGEKESHYVTRRATNGAHLRDCREMNLHSEVCLTSEIWKKSQDRVKAPLPFP